MDSPEMDVEGAFEGFFGAESGLPVKEMRWCLDHWDLAGPELVCYFETTLQNESFEEENLWALLILIHLFGDMLEQAAFAPLCALLLDKTRSEIVLGDAITETLRRILISTFDGDGSRLTRVIESADADEFVRSAALEALSYLYATGRLEGYDMRQYLQRLYLEAEPQGECYLWVAWSITVARLGYEDLVSDVESLFLRRFIVRDSMDLTDFVIRLNMTLSDPSSLAAFDYDRVYPLIDSIGVLSAWHCFARHNQQTPRSSYAAGATNRFRNVGRNDPCPCGSGKKFKKCCLRA